jgi:UDP-N-acetylglucosamine diphosphorylase/glucosamine-1-phosphate N-acetyltransferase
MRIYVFEDAGSAGLEPLSPTRPVFELRCGARTLRERQARRFAAGEAAALVRPELAELYRLEHPEMEVNPADPPGRGPAVFVNGRWLPPAGVAAADVPAVGLVGDEVAFAALPAGRAGAVTYETLPWRLEEWKRALPRREAGGVLVAHPWDLVEHNGAALEQDFAAWDADHDRAPPPAGATVVGPADRVRINPAAVVEPFVLIDATRGPVLIDRDAVVQAFSRLEGPCCVGPGSHVLGAKLRGSSVGPHCRVGGEVEATVLQGYANKAHDGFLGHSYVGEWVNLGAGTQASDLRTDYGPVRFRTRGWAVDSGRLKVGAFLGDHAKTSVGALLNTGTTVGPFGQLLACGGLMPRCVPAFCRYGHGRLQERSDLREMFATAAVVMGRRGRAWAEAHADFFLSLYERTADDRRQALREAEQKRLRRVATAGSGVNGGSFMAV